MKLLRWIAGFCIAATLSLAPFSISAQAADGEQLFDLHCAGCHPHGGNIIRRGRTLKLSALEKRGLDNQEAIARVAREGIGQMSGYGEVLGGNGDIAVAAWVWYQAQKAWIQG